jgi:YbbR domain-containing protein
MGKGYKLNNLRTFLSWQKMGIRFGAICLASLLWIFVISENIYLMVVDMPIEARNLPARHALKEEVPVFAKVRLRGTGRSLFKTILLSRFIPGFKLVLDLERISEEYDFILNDYFERYPQKVSIPSNFNVSYVEVIYPKSIHISLDEYKEKIVLVEPKIQIKTAPGFTIVGKPLISPNKVKIAGSRNIVETIYSVSTISDTVINANSPISIKLSLKSETGQLIEYTPKVVSFKQSIQSISERIISEIPVQILNVRADIQAFVSPQTVSLTVIGGTEFISNLEPENLIISVDFNDWNSKKQFYDLNVETPDDVISWMDLSPQNIELVVTKRAN